MLTVSACIQLESFFDHFKNNQIRNSYYFLEDDFGEGFFYLMFIIAFVLGSSVSGENENTKKKMTAKC